VGVTLLPGNGLPGTPFPFPAPGGSILDPLLGLELGGLGDLGLLSSDLGLGDLEFDHHSFRHLSFGHLSLRDLSFGSDPVVIRRGHHH
jgi:hypothetical protein